MKESDLRSKLEEHHQSAYGWALSCCARHRADAEDVLQAAYVKVLGGKARFNGASSFRTWLFALIRNTAADHRRSLWRRLLREGETEPPTAGTAADEQVLQAERAAGIQAALSRLSARQREVLHLAFYEGMTLEEAARVMGVSIGSARTHYERGKAKLREYLQS
jgi:RNA polymerase sigma-70 factor (ECF subfamily)